MTVTDNVTLVGNVLLNNHVLGNFSTGNYAYNSFVPHLPDYNSWEVSAKIITSSGYVASNVYDILVCGDVDARRSRNCGFLLRIYQNKINLIVERYTNSYQDVADLSSDTIQNNTEYIVKGRFTGSKYELEVNGTVVAYKDATWKGLYNASRMPHLDIGIHSIYVSDNLGAFTGSIDLTKCYFKANGSVLWNGVERSKSFYTPARKGAQGGFFIPARKREVSISHPSLLTVQQATISSDNILTTQSSNNYSFAQTTERIPLDTADTWEWRTKFTRTGGGSSNYPAIIAHSNSNYCSAPYIQVIVSESGKAPYSVDIVIPTSSSAYIGNSTYTHAVTQNTPYYFKFGFTGTEYYLSANITGWDDPFEDWARYSSTTKCYVAPNTVTEFLARYIAGSIQGSMDLNETRLYINGNIYWEYVTNKIVNDFYIPVRKSVDVLSSHLTQIGGSMSSDYVWTKSTNNGSLKINETLPLDTANTWEWRTKINFNSSENYGWIIGHDNVQEWRKAPYIQILNGEAGYNNNVIGIVIPYGGSSYSANYSTNTLQTGHTYYIKWGFTGTSYYLDINESGWDDAFTRWVTITSSTKCYVDPDVKTTFFSRAVNSNTVLGSIDLKETKLLINDLVYFNAVNKTIGAYYPSRKN